MIATHATKAGVRHRYYVSKPALHGEARIAKLGSVSRVPPSEIEGSSNLPSANTSSSQQPQADAIPKTMLDNSTLAAFRTCRRERDFWRRRQTVESHSARLRGRRRCIESIEPAVQFTFRSRPCQYFSLSSRRSIFPVAVRGKASMNSTLLGALKAATRSRAQRITSWGSGLLPGFG